MITTSCDLACPGCDRFIDHGHAFVEKFEENDGSTIITKLKVIISTLQIISDLPNVLYVAMPVAFMNYTEPQAQH